MALDIACPSCGEADNLDGDRRDDVVVIVCGACGQEWDRPLAPTCPTCGGDDLQEVPLAIVEKSRGTQLSVVGIRTIHLCRACDAETLARWHANRPNPLMPGELPNAE